MFGNKILNTAPLINKLETDRYAVLPHAGDHRDAKLTRRGFEFNQPLIVAPTFDPLTALDKPSVLSFFSVDKDNIILETVKKAEKSHDIIIRLWVRSRCSKNT
jgi:alpha-mannosidase